MHAATVPRERRAKRQLPTRDEQIKSLQTESFDVLIIGGGASGSGCALDAVTRGNIKCIAFIPLSRSNYCFHLACIMVLTTPINTVIRLETAVPANQKMYLFDDEQSL